MTGESGTKQLYQPEPKPVVYIVPTTSILGRLPLIPVGDHGTIPAVIIDSSQYERGDRDFPRSQFRMKLRSYNIIEF